MSNLQSLADKRNALAKQLRELDQEIAKAESPEPKDNPTWSEIVEFMDGWVDEMESAVKSGDSYEMGDTTNYLMEVCVEAYYKDTDAFYKLYNKVAL